MPLTRRVGGGLERGTGVPVDNMHTVFPLQLATVSGCIATAVKNGPTIDAVLADSRIRTAKVKRGGVKYDAHPYSQGKEGGC